MIARALHVFPLIYSWTKTLSSEKWTCWLVFSSSSLILSVNSKFETPQAEKYRSLRITILPRRIRSLVKVWTSAGVRAACVGRGGHETYEESG